MKKIFDPVPIEVKGLSDLKFPPLPNPDWRFSVERSFVWYGYSAMNIRKEFPDRVDTELDEFGDSNLIVFSCNNNPRSADYTKFHSVSCEYLSSDFSIFGTNLIKFQAWAKSRVREGSFVAEQVLLQLRMLNTEYFPKYFPTRQPSPGNA